MQIIKLKLYFLIILFVLVSVPTIGQGSINMIGKVIDFNSKESIAGVAIKMFDSNIRNDTEFSVKKGEFDIKLCEKIERVEFHFLGYLPLVIENFDSNTSQTFTTIHLCEDPFGFISFETKPRRRDTKALRQAQRKVKRGLIVVCNNNSQYKMRFSKKNYRFALYVDYKDLMKCHD